MTDPATVPEPTRFDARRVLAEIVNAATLEFVEARGRRPLPAEAAALRRAAAQKAFDTICRTFKGAAPTGVDREQLDTLAAEALGGPWTE